MTLKHNIGSIWISLGIMLCFFTVSSVDAYTMTYYQQDNTTGTTGLYTYAPSVYWAGQCVASLYAYSSSEDSDGTYTVLNQYYSPDMTERATSYHAYGENKTCELQTLFTGLNYSTSLNGFYEEAFKTTSTASMSQDSYLKIVYNCEPDSSEWFTYYNTFNNDSYRNMPFGYLETFTTCFKQSPADCISINPLTMELGNITNYINARYKPCGTGMRAAKDVRYTSSSCGSIVSDATANFYTMVPFNTGVAGRVNISVFNAYAYGSSGYTPSYQFYIYDVETNTTIVNLGTSLFSSTQTLTANKDYWLLLGVRVAVDNFNCGSGAITVGLQWLNYSLSVWAYEPLWSCDYTECINGIKGEFCIDLNGKVPETIRDVACPSGETTYNLSLGFDETNSYIDYIYTCYVFDTGAPLPLNPCSTEKEITTIRLPDGWSSLAFRDVGGILTENTAKLTSEYGYVTGDSALLLRYIPPKMVEPKNNTESSYPLPPTICGNKTTGSKGGVSHSYDNSSYPSISTNLTLSQNPQISFWARKCPETERQYDNRNTVLYWGIFGNSTCGSMYFDGSETGNKTINSNFKISVTGWMNDSVYTPLIYTAITPDATLNNVSAKDNKTDYILLYDSFTTPYGIRINTSVNVTNGTILKLYFFPDVTGYDIKIVAGDSLAYYLMGSIPLGGEGFYNITLTMETETNTFYILSGDGMSSYLDFIEIAKPENQTSQYINRYYPYIAKNDWEKITIPLSDLGLRDNGLYTITLGVLPLSGSLLEANPTCVLFDDFEVQNSINVVTDSITCLSTSGCNMSIGKKTYIEAIWTGSSCVIKISSQYDDRCLTADELVRKNAVDSGTSGYDYYCTDDGVFHILDRSTGLWAHNLNTTLCRVEEPPSDGGNVLIDLIGSLGPFNFFLNPVMIAFYILMAISAVVALETKSWEIGLISFVFLILGTGLASGGVIIPVWVSFIIVLAILILFSYKMSGVANRGGN